MWPWGHLAVGYVVYATYTRYRHDRHPAGLAVVALAVATQFPDLVDKPLAYTVGVLPGGRSLGHSLVIAVPVCVLAFEYARRREGWRADAGIGVVIGYLTHLFGDSLHSLVALEFEYLTFLAWPLLEPPEFETNAFGTHVEQFLESTAELATGTVTPFLLELVLFGLMVGLWLWHRAPPLPSGVVVLRAAVGER